MDIRPSSRGNAPLESCAGLLKDLYFVSLLLSFTLRNMNSANTHLTRADTVLAGAFSIIVAVAFLVAGSLAKRGETVLVQVDGKPVFKASLQDTVVTTVEGAAGRLTLAIRDGKVAIVAADCPNGVCVRTGWCSKSGDVIVCVPNKAVVRILGEGTTAIRAITG